MIQFNYDYFMSDPKKILFQIYFAGASLAFGLPFLIVELISLIVVDEFYQEFSVIFGFIYISIHVLGGIIGGALVARRVQKKDILRAGATTGLMAFIIHQIIYFFFFGASVIGDPYTLFALLGGSVTGSLYIRQNIPVDQEVEKNEDSLPS